MIATSLSRRQALLGLSATAALPGFTAAAAQQTNAARVPTIAQPLNERSLAIVSPDRLAEQSRRVLPAGAWEYIHGAAGSEWTMRANRSALDSLAFRPHRLAGFAQADTRSTLLGVHVGAPLYVCPMGAQDFAHVDAELASVRAAGVAGVPYMLTSASNRSLEEVARVAPPSLLRMFAIYLNTDPAVNRALAARARAAGYRALVMTVDSLGPGNSDDYVAMGSPRTAASGFGNFDPARGGVGSFLNLKRDFTPADIDLLRQTSGLPVVVKGILRADDAERAIVAGAAGVVVSNHGGRTLDGAMPAIDALPDVVRAVRGRVPVLFDSGVRRGADIVRALALGATAVGIGRPALDALALGGARGATDLLEWFQADLATQMLQVGARRIGDLNPDLIVRAAYEGISNGASS